MPMESRFPSARNPYSDPTECLFSSTGIPSYDRLREKGLLTLEEMSARLDIGPKCVITWRNHGLLHGYPVNDRDDWLYEDPGTNPPRKAQGVRLAKRRLFPENVIRGSQEVQYEA